MGHPYGAIALGHNAAVAAQIGVTQVDWREWSSGLASLTLA